MTGRFTQKRHDRDQLRAKLANEEYQEIKTGSMHLKGNFQVEICDFRIILSKVSQDKCPNQII